MRIDVLNFFTMQFNGAGCFLADPENRFNNLGTFRTDQAGNTEDLAFAQLEGHILDWWLIQGGQTFDFQNDFFRPVHFWRETLCQFTTDHHTDDLVHV